MYNSVTGQAPQSTGNNVLDVLMSMRNYLGRISNVIAPPQRSVKVPFLSLAVNSFAQQGNQNIIAVNAAEYNSIIGSVVGNNAQIAVWLSADTSGTTAPDFIFLSGVGSVRIPMSSKKISQISIQSTGNSPATGCILLENC
jgi:hypothetical protein